MQRLIYGLLLAMLCWSSLASPQEVQGQRQFGPWLWGLSGGLVHQFETDLSDAEGDFNVTRFFLQSSFGYSWDRRNSVSLSLGYGESRYDFSSQARIGGSRPWRDIQDYRLSVPIRFSPAERADVIVIPSVRSYVEEGASLSDGDTAGLLVAGGWKISDTLTLGPGFGWFSELGGGSNAFPVILVDWQITEKLALTTGRGMAASQGPGLTLNYQLKDKWKLGLTGRYEKTRFALDGEGNSADDIGEDKSLPLLLTVEYTPWPMTTVSAIIGAEFEGSLGREFANGEEKTVKSDYDTAPIIGLAFSSRF